MWCQRGMISGSSSNKKQMILGPTKIDCRNSHMYMKWYVPIILNYLSIQMSYFSKNNIMSRPDIIQFCWSLKYYIDVYAQIVTFNVESIFGFKLNIIQYIYTSD